MVNQLQQVWWTLCYYVFLLFFFVGIWIANAACLLFVALLPHTAARKALLALVHFLTSIYVALMERSGALQTNRRVLDTIAPGRGGLLLIANHPGMIDAPVLLSRVPGLRCVFKSALKQSLLMPLTARTAGYLSNYDGLQLLRDLEAALLSGSRVLVFPEGTRTTHSPVNHFYKGYALASLRAGVPIQILAIRTNSSILSKRQHFLRAGRFPVIMEFTLGPLIQPGDFPTVQELNAYAEGWFRTRLAVPGPVPENLLPASTRKEQTAERIHGMLTVPGNPAYCRGHMPGNPIVPAYVQIAWARELLDNRGNGDGTDTPCEFQRWKFLQPIRPGDTVFFEAVRDQGAWRFAYTRDGVRLSQGRVIARNGRECS